MDDKAGMTDGQKLFDQKEKAKDDGILPAEVIPLVVDYLSTKIQNECHVLFSQNLSRVYAADSEKALSSELDKLNATLESYSSRAKGDYRRTVNSIANRIIDSGVKVNEISAAVKKEIAQLHDYNWLNNSLECTELFNQAIVTIKSSQENVTVNFYEGKSASLEITRNYNGSSKSWLYRWEEEPPTVWLYNLSYVFIQDFDNDAYYTEAYNTEDETFLIRKYSDTGFEVTVHQGPIDRQL